MIDPIIIYPLLRMRDGWSYQQIMGNQLKLNVYFTVELRHSSVMLHGVLSWGR
jgi:hypothetical protein